LNNLSSVQAARAIQDWGGFWRTISAPFLTCSEGHTDRLCSRCEPGFSASGRTCHRCSPLATAFTVIAFVVISTVVGVRVLSGRAVKRTGLTRILILHIQLASYFPDMAASLPSAATAVVGAGAVGPSLLTISGIECLFSPNIGDATVDPLLLRFTVASLLPLRILLLAIACAGITRGLEHLRHWQQARRYRHAAAHAPAGTALAAAAAAAAGAPPQGGLGPDSSPRGSVTGPGRGGDFADDDAPDNSLVGRLPLPRAIAVAFAYLWILLSGPTLKTLASPLNCTSLGSGLNHRYVTTALWFRCDTGHRYRLLSTMSGILTVAFPAITVGLLVATSVRMRGPSATYRPRSRGFRSNLRELTTAPFRDGAFYWEGIHFARRALLALAWSLSPDGSIVLPAAASLTLLAALGAQLVKRPFKSRIDNIAETTSLLVLIFSFYLSTVIARAADHGTAVASWVLLVLNLVFCAGLAAAIGSRKVAAAIASRTTDALRSRYNSGASVGSSIGDRELDVPFLSKQRTQRRSTGLRIDAA
jgi:hypothetical protein